MYILNDEQTQALQKIQDFLSNDTFDVFILRGSAGTGKTTLIGKLAEYLQNNNQSFSLLAPTGRASRILGAKIKQMTNIQTESATIHRMIYQLDKVVSNDNEILSENDPALRFYYPLRDDESYVNLLIIDESSMISDKENNSDFIQFGSGRLLKDIIQFSRIARFNQVNNHTTKILFAGDMAQLSPVGDNTSPALSSEYLQREYNISSDSFDLTQVMRQSNDSKILEEATNIRNAIFNNKFNNFEIKTNNRDIISLNTNQSLDWIINNIASKKSSVAVVFSNENALKYNRSIREKMYGHADAPTQEGDLLLVNKNSVLNDFSNGDLIKVIATNKNSKTRSISLKIKQQNGEIKEEIITLAFRSIVVGYRSNNGNIQKDCFILENLLNSKNRELTPLEIRALYVDFLIRNPQVESNPALKQELLKKDPYFNALQVKYGYAITCHKAQGGEWENVLVDFSDRKGFDNKEFFQWAYTAITRASKNLVIINSPIFSEMSTMSWGNLTIDNSAQEAKKEVNLLDKIHQQLSEKWHELGFEIQELKHFQYCERYTILAGNKIVNVQYFYNGKFNITRYEVMPNSNIDKDLSKKILSVFSFNGNQQNDSINFIGDFIEHIEKKLQDSNIKLLDYKEMPYRLRIKFSDDSRIGEIDFNYNGKQQWTTVQEVGGIGNTNGLYQEIATLVKG